MASSAVGQVQASRVYVVGDIHGCSVETEILYHYLSKNEGLTDQDCILFLGDYIDRGPDSKGVIELMLEIKKSLPLSRFLKGNHEDMLMDFLGYGGNLGQAFLYNGGLETIQSYGISVFSPPTEMVGALPPEHFKFFCDLDSILLVNNHFICVHAGLNPLRDLYAQNNSDVFWIREEFLSSVHQFGRTIVFGHTPHQEIFLHVPFKVGLDTGLVFGNKLTCLELESGKLWQIKKGSKDVVASSLSPQ